MSNFRFIFDLNDYTEYLDLSRFQFYHAAISGFTLAIATDRHLVLSDGVSDGLNQQEATIRVVLEFNEDSIRATTIAWITDEVIAVGFESGFVVCFNCLGEEIFEYRGNKSSVQSIRFSSADVNGKGPGIWILYELGYLISIPLSQVLKGKSDSFVAFKFAEHVALNDFVFCPMIYSPSIFDLDGGNNGASHSVLVSGMNSALSLYNLGGKLHFQDFDKLTGYAKEKVSSMLSKSFMSLFSSLTSSSSSTTSANDAAKARHDRTEDPLKVEERAITLTSMLDFQDAKRRILRLSVEPFGSLVAAADSLGRVTLYDTGTNCIVRVWKGLRDARLAWTHSLETVEGEKEESGSTSRSNSLNSTTRSVEELATAGAGEVARLHLVVYAPQLGLVSVYRMPQGACLRIVPVGLNGQLCTIMDETNSGLRVAKSFLIRAVAAGADGAEGNQSEAGCSVEMIEMDPAQYSESDIDVHSASAIALLGGGGGDEHSGATDDVLSEEEDVLDEVGGRSVGRMAVELRLLQKLEKAFTNLAEGHGSVARATAAASALNVEISGRAVDEGLVLAAEQRVWELLGDSTSSHSNSKRQLSLRGVLRVMGMVESMELRGSSEWNTTGIVVPVVSPIHARSVVKSGPADCGRGICFSIQFHSKLSSLLNDVLNCSIVSEEENEGSALMKEVVAVEVRLRERLLSAYEQLLDIHANFEQNANQHRETLGGGVSSSVMFSSPSAASPLGGQQADETAVICRGNNSRAEALCWALRATKKAERSAARLRVRRQTEDKQQQAQSPKVLRSVGSLTAMHSLSPAGSSLGSSIGLTPPGGRAGPSLHAVRRPLVGVHSSPQSQATMGSSRSSDPHLAVSSSVSQTVLLGGRPLFSVNGSLSFDCISVSFSAFRAFHKQFFRAAINDGATEKEDGLLDAEVQFNSEELLAFVAAADQYFHPGRKIKTAVATDVALHQPPQLRKTPVLQSFLKRTGSFSSSNSPSLTIAKSRKFVSAPAPMSSPDRGDLFGLLLESVFCSDLLGPSRPLLFATTAVQVGTAVSVLWTPPSMSIAYSLLQLVAAPLQGDLFAMGAFSAATRLMGASGPEGITRLLPLHLAYIAHQPVGVLVSEVLTRKLSTSPMQRWLRDALLTFQDLVAACGLAAFDKLLAVRPPDSSKDQDVFSAEVPQSRSVQSGGNNLLSDLDAEDEEEEEGEKDPLNASLSRGSSFNGGGGGESDQLLTLTTEVLRQRRISKELPSNANRVQEEQEAELLPPSYDEFVRHILRPVWVCARECTNLEAVLAFAAVVLETLQTVHEQVERRTYGASGLALTIAAWENLVRQTRVALLLSSRVGLEKDAMEITVQRLGSGCVSLHRLLAADTLCFAVRADQAVEHEERCQEVFNRRSAGVGGGEQGDSAARSDVLLAWGRVADKRWRDLIAVAVAEDAIEGGEGAAAEKSKGSDDEEEGTPQKKRAPPVRRRRPLLLYFPRHSQQRFLGGYRALILAERWALKVHHVEGLALVSEHLFALPNNWRGAVAAEVYLTHVLPLVQAFMALEEDTFSSQSQNDVSPLTREAPEDSTVKAQLLIILGDVGLLKTFVRAAVEILRFVEICVVSAVRESSVGQKTGGVTIGGKAHPVDPCAAEGEGCADRFAQEVNESVWPGTSDRRMNKLYAQFFWSTGAEGDTSALSLVREVVAPKWSADLLQAHISVLWVLLLRFQCGLRGIRPSKVLGIHTTRSLQALDEVHNSQPFCREEKGTSEMLESVVSIRMEFLNQCLRRLIAVDPPVAVYRLAELWAVNLDAVRLLHITALLERGGSLDDEVDLLVPQVADGGAVVDVVTAALRNRLGGVVARIDRLAVFGPLLAAMDAEAVSWARKALPGDFTPDSAALEDIARGKARAININLASTRHLVISMQGVLLAVPVTERYGAPKDGEAGTAVTNSWLERKSKCDALLSLCNSFSHLSGGKSSSRT